MLGDVQTHVFFQHPHHGHGSGHDGGLGVFGEGKIGLGAFPHQLGQLLGQRIIDFLEDFARRAESTGKLLAHADFLAALTGEKKCASHYEARQISGPQVKAEKWVAVFEFCLLPSPSRRHSPAT